MPKAATPDDQFGSKPKWGSPKATTPEGGQQGSLGARPSQNDPSTQGPPGIGAEGGEVGHDQSQTSSPARPELVDRGTGAETGRQQDRPVSTSQGIGDSPPRPSYKPETGQPQGVSISPNVDVSPSYETRTERPQVISASPLGPSYEVGTERQKDEPTSTSQEIEATPSSPSRMTDPAQKEAATTFSREPSTAPRIARYGAGPGGQFIPYINQSDRGQYRPPFSARGERQEGKGYPSRRWEPPVSPQIWETLKETEAPRQHGVAREKAKTETRDTAASPSSPPYETRTERQQGISAGAPQDTTTSPLSSPQEHEAGQREGISTGTPQGAAASSPSPPHDHGAGRQKDAPASTSQEIGTRSSPPHMADPGQKEAATTSSQGPTPKITWYEPDASRRGQFTPHLDQSDRGQYRPPFSTRGERQQDTSGFSQARSDREQPGAPYSRQVSSEERQEAKSHPSRRWEPPTFPQKWSARTETETSYQHEVSRVEQKDKIETGKLSKEAWPETLDEARGLQGGEQYLSDLKNYNRTRAEAFTMGQEQSRAEPKSTAHKSRELGSDIVKEEPLQPFRDMSEQRIRRPKTLSPEEIEFEKRQLLRTREKLRTRPGFDASESAILEEEGVLSGKAAKKAKKAKKREKKQKKAEGAMIPLYLPEYISVANLATALKTRLDDFTAQLKIMGFTDFSHDHIMNAEIAGLIAMEYGYEPIADTSKEEDLLPRHVMLAFPVLED